MISHASPTGMQTKLLTIAVFTFIVILSLPLAESQDIRQFVESLQKNPLPEYARNKLAETTKNLGAFNEDTITTLDEEESIHELVRILKTTRISYHALNHYIYGWNTKLEYLYRVNVEAVKRGIVVTRTFILTEDVLQNTAKLLDAVRIMETQQKDGITVFYGLQRELQKEPDYHKYVLMDAGLSDDNVFAWVTAVSVKGPQPAKIIITWKRSIINEKNPFPYLGRSPHIYPFDETAKKRMLEIAGEKSAQQ